MKEVPILSFFTGAGFMDIGFAQQGFKSVWHNEYYAPFRAAFETGMQSMGFEGAESKIQNPDSIVDVGPSQIQKEAFLGKKAPALFGMIGGPPCPDFSVAGKNRGHQGDNGKLTEVYVNRIREIFPDFFVLENVPGLLRTAKHRISLIAILEKLNVQYVVDLKILNSLEYGVPQDRERVFVVGFKRKWFRKKYSSDVCERVFRRALFFRDLETITVKDVLGAFPHWFPWPVDHRYREAKRRFDWPAEPSPFGGNPDVPENCPRELMVGTYICSEDRFNLANSQEWFRPKSEKFSEIQEGAVAKKCFKRLHRYRYSPAAAYGNNEVHLHPTEARRLSVREAMMIQSVPDDYRLPEDMTLTAKFKTIGNGVPVKLAAAVASSIRNVLEGQIDG